MKCRCQSGYCFSVFLTCIEHYHHDFLVVARFLFYVAHFMCMCLFQTFPIALAALVRRDIMFREANMSLYVYFNALVFSTMVTDMVAPDTVAPDCLWHKLILFVICYLVVRTLTILVEHRQRNSAAKQSC